MSDIANGNGRALLNRLLYWATGLLVTTLLTIGLWWASIITNNLQEVTILLSRIEERLNAHSNSYGHAGTEKDIKDLRRDVDKLVGQQRRVRRLQ